MPLGLPPGKKIVPVVSAFWRGTLSRPEHLVAPRASCAIAPNKVGLRISAMVISRFGERDQYGSWCCAVREL